MTELTECEKLLMAIYHDERKVVNFMLKHNPSLKTSPYRAIGQGRGQEVIDLIKNLREE